MVNPAGYTALDMIGFTDQGAYSSSDNYVKNDLVHYSGNIWRCLIDDTSGIAPAEGVNWTLFIGEPTNLVERIIAPVETDPATSAWAVGRQIIFNDNLYEVIAAITAGDALVAYEDDPTNANIKLADPVETQLLNVKGNLSNRNLLDNAWFTVNQRGQSVYSATNNQPVYINDRWAGIQLNTKHITPKANGGITVDYTPTTTSISWFVCEQILPEDISDNLCGQTITLSAKISNRINMLGISLRVYDDATYATHNIRLDDGSILSYENGILEGQVTIPSTLSSGHIKIGIYASTALTDYTDSSFDIDAVKLEIGSISTLAMDTAPNYAEELLKCQRYFYRMNTGGGIFQQIGIARAVSATQVEAQVKLPTTMRSNPSVTVDGNITAFKIFGNGSSVVASSYTGTRFYGDYKKILFTTASNLVVNELYSVEVASTAETDTTYIDFSADL